MSKKKTNGEKFAFGKLLLKRKFRVTRYRINKAGKLQARQDGYVCKTPDVIGLEEMVGVKHEENKFLRKRNLELEQDAGRLSRALTDTTLRLGSLKTLNTDAIELLKAHDAQDAELVEKAKDRIVLKGYWRRLFSAVFAK